MRKLIVHPDDMRCSDCALSSLCLPVGIPGDDIAKLDALINERIRIEKGAALFLSGDPVRSVYAIRSGSIKTQLEDAHGHIQITGFFLPGEIVGMEGLLSSIQRSAERRVGKECVSTCRSR